MVSKIFIFTKGLAEIAFTHFLFSNITNPGFFSVKWKSFKDHDVYIINFFRVTHTLKRNLSKLV